MIEPTDIILRTVAVASAVLLAALLLKIGPRRRAAWPAAMFCLAVAAFWATSTPLSRGLGAWGVLLTGVCVTKAAWFWLFSRALFNDDFRIRYHHLLVVAVVAVIGTWQQKIYLPDYRAGLASTWEMAAGISVDAILLTLVVLALYTTWRGLATDLVERRRQLRVGFLLASGAYLGATVIVQSYNLLISASTPEIVAWANMIVVSIGFLSAAALLLQFRNDTWLEQDRPIATDALTPLESNVLTQLQHELETDRVFLQEGLTIGQLARRLGTSEPVLRRVINRGMGYRNFNDFLHAWRIREACEELSRPEQARTPVLSIAMKVGYGSIGAFNRAFKARIGMTPTDYRRSTLNGASHVH